MQTQNDIESLLLQYGYHYTNSVNFYKDDNGSIITFDLSNEKLHFRDKNITLQNSDINLQNIKRYLR
mgnify:CR=1 FL=1